MGRPELQDCFDTCRDRRAYHRHIRLLPLYLGGIRDRPRCDIDMGRGVLRIGRPQYPVRPYRFNMDCIPLRIRNRMVSGRCCRESRLVCRRGQMLGNGLRRKTVHLHSHAGVREVGSRHSQALLFGQCQVGNRGSGFGYSLHIRCSKSDRICRWHLLLRMELCGRFRDARGHGRGHRGFQIDLHRKAVYRHIRPRRSISDLQRRGTDRSTVGDRIRSLGDLQIHRRGQLSGYGNGR